MSGNYVIRSIPRAASDAIEQLGAAGVATVHEAQGRTGLLDHNIMARQSGARIAGSAVTALCAPGDNFMIHAAVEVIEPGDILVVAVMEPAIHGMFGDLLAASVMARGCRGLVIDSAVRDIAELNEMGFPIWSRAIHSQGTVKATPGSVNLPVDCAGARVNPGDVIVADADGVVVVDRTTAGDVAAAAAARLDKEELARAQLEAGELGLDFYGLRDKLEATGVVWLESADEIQADG